MDAIYARQSLEKEGSLSIAGQIALCEKHAGPERQIFEDRGFSGKNTNRPGFLRLMEGVRGGRIQKILVYRLDRFSRSIADFSRIWEELERHGVAFQSVTEQFDTASPMGRAMLNIVMTFAQLERETTAERVRDNYFHRVSLGAWPGGPAPYGFTLGKRRTPAGGQASTLVADEHAPLVRQIFQRYVETDLSLRALAKELTAQGIHGPKREAWDNVTLSRLLRSPLYVRADAEVYWYYLAQGMEIVQPVEAFAGVYGCNLIGRRNRAKGQIAPAGQRLTIANHEGILPAPLWLAAQDKLRKNRQIPRTNGGKYTWLSGLLKCGKCGYAVKINWDKRADTYYLMCSGRSNLSLCTASIRVDLRGLEAAVAKEIQALLAECPPEPLGEAEPDTVQQALELEEKIQRLVSALASSSEVSAAYISQQIEGLHRQREGLLTSQRQAKLQHVDFLGADFAEKKLIAGELVERVLLEGEQATIVWKV